MKNNLLIMIAGLVGTYSLLASPINSGFEQGWQGWNKNAQSNVPIKWNISDKISHSGRKCLHISFDGNYKSGVYATIWQKVPVNANSSYIIKIWVKAKNAGTIIFGGGKKWEIRKSTDKGTYDWKEFICPITTGPHDTFFTVRLIIENRIKNAWVDDISIERKYDKSLSPVYSVTDAGAVPDGKTDCTTSFHKALTSGHGIIYVPPGRYALTSVTIPPGTILMGSGSDSLIIPYLKPVPQTKKNDGNKIHGDESALHKLIIMSSRSTVKNLLVDGGGRNVVGISSKGTRDILIENCKIWNSKSFGIHLDHVNQGIIRRNSISKVKRAINIDFSNNLRVCNNNVSDCTQHGIQFWGNYNWQDDKRCSNMIFSGNIVKNGGRGAIWGTGYRNVIMSNNLIDGAEDVGLDLEWTDDSVITGNVVHNAKNGGIALFFRCRRITISGNTVINNREWKENPKGWWVRAGIWLTYPNRDVYKQDTGHEDININGNTIFNHPGVRRAIWVGSEAKRVSITNCNINKDQIYFGGAHKKNDATIDRFSHCPVFIDSHSNASNKLK